MGEVFDAIVASIGEYVEADYEDLPIISVPSPPVPVTTHKRKWTDSKCSPAGSGILTELDGSALLGSGDAGEYKAEDHDISGLAVDATQEAVPRKRTKWLKVCPWFNQGDFGCGE